MFLQSLSCSFLCLSFSFQFRVWNLQSHRQCIDSQFNLQLTDFDENPENIATNQSMTLAVIDQLTGLFQNSLKFRNFISYQFLFFIVPVMQPSISVLRHVGSPEQFKLLAMIATQSNTQVTLLVLLALSPLSSSPLSSRSLSISSSISLASPR